jgi:hypothetical protein
VQPFSLATADTDALVARNAFAPVPGSFSFVRGDAIEPRLRPEERRALAAIGRDELQSRRPRLGHPRPLVGRDDVVFAASLPDTTSYRHARDGIERPLPARLRI